MIAFLMMEQMLVYALKSVLILILLNLPYSLMLRQERFFRMNRFMLLTVLTLSLLQPLCKVTSFDGFTQTGVITEAIASTQQFVYQTETMLTDKDVSTHWRWLSWLSLVYVTGVAVVLCMRLYQLIQIRRAMYRGCLWQQNYNGINVYCHVGQGAPFSWMNNIYISEEDFEMNRKAILLHEQAHILYYHSFDILLLTIVEAIQWWNPIVYKLGQSLRDVHEYEADDYVLRQGVSLEDYKTLLVRKALADTSFAFANNFTHSQIQKRLYMMKHPKSSPWMRTKALYILPLSLVGLTIFASPKLSKKVENIIEVTQPTVPLIVEKSNAAVDERKETKLAKRPEQDIRPKKNTIPLVTNNYSHSRGLQSSPEFPGGMTALRSYVAKNVAQKLQEGTLAAGKQACIQFRVNADGTLGEIGLIFGDNEAFHEAVKMVEQMPRWIPAHNDGKPISSYFVLPIEYSKENVQ